MVVIFSCQFTEYFVAPATDAIEYEVVKFHAGPLNNEENDIYSSPPSPEVDQAWRNLYESECSNAQRPTLLAEILKSALYNYHKM